MTAEYSTMIWGTSEDCERLWEFLAQDEVKEYLYEFDEACESIKRGMFVKDKLPRE